MLCGMITIYITLGLGSLTMCVLLQDEGWRPSITVKQIVLGIQVPAAACSHQP